jgi:glycosyltransferase involved in cell wall biosynthesis
VDESTRAEWTSSPESAASRAAAGHPLRVLQFSNALVRGGAEEHILHLVRGLDRARFRLHLVCPPELARALLSDLPSDVELTTLRLRGPAHVWSIMRLAWLIAARRIDILHSHLSFGSLFASPIGWACRVPVIVETPNLNDPAPRRWAALWTLSDLVVNSCIDVSIAVAQANARHLVAKKRRSAAKVVVIHNAADLRRFDPDRPPPSEMRRSLGFPEEALVLVTVARLQPQKGHRVLLDALVTVRREFPLVRLVCVGDGPLRSELERRVSELGLQDTVRFVGDRRDVPDWLALAELSVLPSFFEGLPLVAIESLAAGRPVVATAVDGTPEAVVDGVTGLTVPSGNAGRLAEAICRLLRDPDLRRRLGATGRRLAEERFDREHQLSEIQALYTKAWNARTRRRGRRPSERHVPRGRDVPCPPLDEAVDVESVRDELTRAQLERVGSGFEKVVFGSRRWVVKIPRDERGLGAALLATVAVDRARRLLARRHPAVRFRAGSRIWTVLREAFRVAIVMVPERWWRGSRVERRVRWLRARAEACERLARRRLDGTALTPGRVEILPTRIRTARWGRRWTVTTAHQRVDRSLADEAWRCLRLGRFQNLEQWLDRFLAFQTELWRRGVFFGASNPLENHGVLGDRLVLLDESGLTDDPREIRLTLDSVRARWLDAMRDLDARRRRQPPRESFAQRLTRLMQPSVIREHWPTPDDPRWDG